jgi:probable phosphoglycerate mutase
MELLLVRHGRTHHNVSNYMDTVPPGAPLDQEGLVQATLLAEQLADEPVVGLYASRAVRAQQTAAAISTRVGLPVQVLDGVHEVFVGQLEGLMGDVPLARYHEYFRAWAEGDRAKPLPGGESAQDVERRFDASLRSVLAQHDGGVVVVVSHGGAIRIAARALDPTVTTQMLLDGALPNTGWVRLRADPGATADGRPAWRCVEWTGLTLTPPLTAQPGGAFHGHH